MVLPFERQYPNKPPASKKGMSVTPRTCLWPLTGSLVLTFALSFGLTFRSNHHCYAGTCGEWLFPLQARLHVVIWYSWVAITVAFLAVRAFHPRMQKVLSHLLTNLKIPLLGKNLTLSGLLMLLWIAALYAVIVVVWWARLRDYFIGRLASGGTSHGGKRLAAIALTGHLCDVTMGMVLLPISRHSALASFFKLSSSTTVLNHMLSAYVLFSLVLIHGFLYGSWVPVFFASKDKLRMVIPVLNPTYLYVETWPGNSTALGIWRSSLIFTGLLCAVIMLAIFVTTLPAIRSKHFNLFYFTHFLGIFMVIVICLHASTMFYCTAPGLSMWFLDWGMRMHELRRSLDGEIEDIGRGWYCITLPLPRSRLSGCSSRSPLVHFFIYHQGSSMRELHPFTTVTHLASQNLLTPIEDDAFAIQFLFRKSGKSKTTSPLNGARRNLCFSFSKLFRCRSQHNQSLQWTDKLASLIDEQRASRKLCYDEEETLYKTTSGLVPRAELLTMQEREPSYRASKVGVSIRLEGPYFSSADPSRYSVVVCLVAGTGISGAIAIANAFIARRNPQRKQECRDCFVPTSTSRWKRCVIVWSVKFEDAVKLPFIDRSSEIEMQTHLTGRGRKRVDFNEVLAQIRKGAEKAKMFVYLSGPESYVKAGKEACKADGNVDCHAGS